MNILFTKLSEFVIILRNSDNNKFWIRPKSDAIIERANNSVVTSIYEGIVTEDEIIEMINKGTSFYTQNDDLFTPVVIVDNNIKSYRNGTTEDNIGALPIHSKI